jgi:hypothetical protein
MSSLRSGSRAGSMEQGLLQLLNLQKGDASRIDGRREVRLCLAPSIGCATLIVAAGVTMLNRVSPAKSEKDCRDGTGAVAPLLTIPRRSEPLL